MSISIIKTVKEIKVMDFRNIYSAYVQDCNLYIRTHMDGIVFTQLENALKTGKTCIEYSLYKRSYEQEFDCLITDLLTANNIKDLQELYNRVVNNDIEFLTNSDITVTKREHKGVDVFSPFVEMKPIKTPAKWTKNHLIKAILSGQIYKAEVKAHYSDDYYGDGERNYNKGKDIDLIDFANDLINNGSKGWNISIDKSENGIVQLSVDCYTFSYNTFYFDVNRIEKPVLNIIDIAPVKKEIISKIETPATKSNVIDFMKYKRAI